MEYHFSQQVLKVLCLQIGFSGQTEIPEAQFLMEGTDILGDFF